MAIRRVRDPVHNLVRFDETDQTERAAWNILQSAPFQRLRRIKQLGLSEFVYPGATHTRLAHSIGVFHTAKELMEIVRKKDNPAKRNEWKEKITLIAALLHDIGHGPFSHVFEDAGKRLGLKFVNHEKMTVRLVRESELADILARQEMGKSFPDDIADIIEKGKSKKRTFHNAIISSQFDADRLDYMRRDRLMTGTQNSEIDFRWLMDNLEIGETSDSAGEKSLGHVPPFVIGAKAVQEVEAYVLGLFQLYPTVYFHKATRGAEKIFIELLVRFFELAQNGSSGKTGLSDNHPLIRFAKEPEKIEHFLALDDAAIWGALGLMKEAQDLLLANFSKRLLNRSLYKCIDVRAHFSGDSERQIDARCRTIFEKLEETRKAQKGDMPKIMTDEAERAAYKTSDDPMEQINVRAENGEFIDLEQKSEIVAAMKPFKLARVYYDSDDKETERKIRAIME